MEQAEKAREKAQQGGGVFQEKFQELKQTRALRVPLSLSLMGSRAF